MYEMKTVFLLDDKTILEIKGFLYTSPQPYAPIDVLKKTYRIIRYEDDFTRNKIEKLVITRKVFLQEFVLNSSF